jgi:hypothetical protein
MSGDGQGQDLLGSGPHTSGCGAPEFLRVRCRMGRGGGLTSLVTVPVAPIRRIAGSSGATTGAKRISLRILVGWRKWTKHRKAALLLGWRRRMFRFGQRFLPKLSESIMPHMQTSLFHCMILCEFLPTFLSKV